jgi:hypothetical protein
VSFKNLLFDSLPPAHQLRQIEYYDVCMGHNDFHAQKPVLRQENKFESSAGANEISLN